MTPWTVVLQAPPSMGFSRQEYWSGLPLPSPGDLPSPGIEPLSSASPSLALYHFTLLYHSDTWDTAQDCKAPWTQCQPCNSEPLEIRCPLCSCCPPGTHWRLGQSNSGPDTAEASWTGAPGSREESNLLSMLPCWRPVFPNSMNSGRLFCLRLFTDNERQTPFFDCTREPPGSWNCPALFLICRGAARLQDAFSSCVPPLLEMGQLGEAVQIKTMGRGPSALCSWGRVCDCPAATGPSVQETRLVPGHYEA